MYAIAYTTSRGSPRAGFDCAYAYSYIWGMAPVTVRLRELRKARGLTQAALAARAGVRRATVNRIENGRVTSIDLGVLEKLANALSVHAAVLIDQTPAKLRRRRNG